MRIGAKKRPFYRVVAVDEQKKRTGGYLELLGTYNPLTEPKEINLKQDRIDEWIKKGAQLSDGFLRITGKAPQRPPRKPKKERKKATEATTSGVKSEEPEGQKDSEELRDPENQNVSESDVSEKTDSTDTPSNSDTPGSSDEKP